MPRSVSEPELATPMQKKKNKKPAHSAGSCDAAVQHGFYRERVTNNLDTALTGGFLSFWAFTLCLHKLSVGLNPFWDDASVLWVFVVPIGLAGLKMAIMAIFKNVTIARPRSAC